MSDCGPRQPRYLMDSLLIASQLRREGPKTWKELEMMACIMGIDPGDCDKAVLCALKTGLIKATFEFNDHGSLAKDIP